VLFPIWQELCKSLQWFETMGNMGGDGGGGGDVYNDHANNSEMMGLHPPPSLCFKDYVGYLG